MWKIWANQLLPKALKNCIESHKTPNLVTVFASPTLCFQRKTFTFATGSRTFGHCYKHFMLVNYDSRVIIWGIFKSGMTLES